MCSVTGVWWPLTAIENTSSAGSVTSSSIRLATSLFMPSRVPRRAPRAKSRSGLDRMPRIRVNPSTTRRLAGYGGLNRFNKPVQKAEQPNERRSARGSRTTSDDRRRRAARRREQGPRLVRAQRPTGRQRRHPRPHPRGRRRDGLVARPAGPLAQHQPLVRARARAASRHRDRRRRPVLPGLHRRRRARTVAGRSGARAGLGADRGARGRHVPQVRRPSAASTASSSPTCARATSGSRSSSRSAWPPSRSAIPTSTRPSPPSPSTMSTGSPRPSPTWSVSVTAGSRTSPARPTCCTPAGARPHSKRPARSAASRAVSSRRTSAPERAARRRGLSLPTSRLARPRSRTRTTSWRSPGVAVAQRAGLSVPRDLSVSGFDDSDIARYVYPSLTSVATDAVEWGAVAARSLLASIAGVPLDDTETGAGAPRGARIHRTRATPHPPR